MSDNDYIEKCRRRRPELFKAIKVQMTPDSMMKMIRDAFNAGRESGRREKSLFERILGS